jgi:hypothetical protein
VPLVLTQADSPPTEQLVAPPMHLGRQAPDWHASPSRHA